MRSITTSTTRGAVAAFAALSLVLVACDADETPELPFEETPEETPEEAPQDTEAGDHGDDEAMALPAGVFGPECQAILESVEHDADTLASPNGFEDEGPGAADEGRTGEDGVTGEEGRTGEGGVTGDGGRTGEDGVTGDDAPGAATADPGATTRLASMSMQEALQAIPALQPIADQLNGVEGAEALEGQQLTVFAPIEDAPQGRLDDGSTAGGVAEEGADTQQEGLGTEDPGEDVGTDEAGDEPGVEDDGAAGTTGDLDRLVRAHVHVGGALDAAALIEQSPITTLDDEVELQVRVETQSATTEEGVTTEDDATTGDGAATEEGVTTEDDVTTDEETSGEAGADGTATVEELTLIVDAAGTQATVLCANIETADGYIHIIDEALDTGNGVGTEDEGPETGTDDEDPIDDADDEEPLDGADEDDLEDDTEEEGIGG